MKYLDLCKNLNSFYCTLLYKNYIALYHYFQPNLYFHQHIVNKVL